MMMKISKNMDKIIDKLKKLLALAERGEKGEAYNARKILERELEIHGLTIEDLHSELVKDRVIPYKNKQEESLLVQILVSVCGRDSDSFQQATYDSRKKEVYIKLTDINYIDIINMWNFHRKQFIVEKKRLLKELFSAYVNKHNIFDPNDTSTTNKDDIDWEEIHRIMSLCNSMDNVTYHKQLE